MKLNLGCGPDLRPGYLNVDFTKPACAMRTDAEFVFLDLATFPWPWDDGSSDEILMLDFLEHFSYRDTQKILGECHRVLCLAGKLVVQVPDFSHCASAMKLSGDFQCNRCGWWFVDGRSNFGHCGKCGQAVFDVQEAAMHRLYGGQERHGNWHYAAFTTTTLTRKLLAAGFNDVVKEERNENGETYEQNWNIRLVAKKAERSPWDE